MGSLRKNLVFFDIEKEKSKYITSSFLSDLNNYENVRVSQSTSKIAMFNKMKVSLLDKNNVYSGSLLANELISDVQFSPNNQNILYGITLDGIY